MDPVVFRINMDQADAYNNANSDQPISVARHRFPKLSSENLPVLPTQFPKALALPSAMTIQERILREELINASNAIQRFHDSKGVMRLMVQGDKLLLETKGYPYGAPQNQFELDFAEVGLHLDKLIERAKSTGLLDNQKYGARRVAYTAHLIEALENQVHKLKAGLEHFQRRREQTLDRLCQASLAMAQVAQNSRFHLECTESGALKAVERRSPGSKQKQAQALSKVLRIIKDAVDLLGSLKFDYTHFDSEEQELLSKEGNIRDFLEDCVRALPHTAWKNPELQALKSQILDYMLARGIPGSYQIV